MKINTYTKFCCYFYVMLLGTSPQALPPFQHKQGIVFKKDVHKGNKNYVRVSNTIIIRKCNFWLHVYFPNALIPIIIIPTTSLS